MSEVKIKAAIRREAVGAGSGSRVGAAAGARAVAEAGSRSVGRAGAAEKPAPPSPAKLRSMFATSAEALLSNRPLRGVSQPALHASGALAKGELAALVGAGLSVEPWVPERADDPLTQTIVDYVALIETSLGAAEVAGILQVDVSRVRQRLRERSLFGVEYEGEWKLPKFQFERRKVLPGLSTVLMAVPAEMNALEVAEWFLSPNSDLEIEGKDRPFSPRDWLLRGLPPERVAELAREL